MLAEPPKGSTSTGSIVLDGPAALLARSVESSKDIKSFRATIEMDMAMLGPQIPLSMEMEKSSDGRVRMVMSMTAAGAGMNIETIMSDEGLFTKMPGVGWVSVSSRALAGIGGQSMLGLDDPVGFYNNLSPARAYLGNCTTWNPWATRRLTGSARSASA